MRSSVLTRRLCLLILCLLVSRPSVAQSPAESDWKAAFGPEALLRRETHGAVLVHGIGDGINRIYVFLPSRPALTRGLVPIVFFHHGWQGMNPKNYGALIDHLASEGNVVLFPVYQDSDATSPQIVTSVAAAAERSALRWMSDQGIVPAPGQVVYFGYSMGAAISLKLAVTAKQEGIPAPDALVLAAPGDAYHVAHGDNGRSIWPDMTLLPKNLPIAILTGVDDRAIGLPTARKLEAALCRAGIKHHSLLVLPSDTHGDVRVVAGHASPGAPDTRFDWPLSIHTSDLPAELPARGSYEPSASLNQLDFFGYWKALDALLDSLAKENKYAGAYIPPSSVFTNGVPSQLYLGTWADGTPYALAHSEPGCSK